VLGEHGAVQLLARHLQLNLVTLLHVRLNFLDDFLLLSLVNLLFGIRKGLSTANT